jgi:hypothetical protein
MDDKIQSLKELLQQKRYDDAREILHSMNHPKKAEWLEKIDAMEQKNKPVEKAAPPTSVLSKKPLPLLLEEEKSKLPRGRPYPPQAILSDKVDAKGLPVRQRGLLLVMIPLLGVKSGSLIINYWKMHRSLALGVSLIFYIGAIVGFILGLYLLMFGVATNNAIQIGLATLLIGLLPATPYLLAWVQDEHYRQWKRHYENMLREHHANNSVE